MICVSLVFSLILVSPGFSQEVSTEADTAAEEKTALPEQTSGSLEPIFPAINPGLIFLEAENAVSTNFAKEATLNYAASAFRTLQLNRQTGLYGGAPFYVEYVFYVANPGTYELWIGGTPPGPREDVYPSYASPFSYSVDGDQSATVFREDVQVVEGYTPAYYWFSVDSMELDRGVHTLRLEVKDKRRFDGRYFFYIDSLFFLDPSQSGMEEAVTPEVFPSDLEDATFDTPFRSINDYQYLIGVEPDNVDLYIELSLIYSMIGDYLNALRNLNKAGSLDPENPTVALLSAKYRIWKGDAQDGLKAYERYLEIESDNKEGWVEAGKVAAWIGKYDDSIRFYETALAQFPGDLNITVNTALTYLWASRVADAEKTFALAENLAVGDVALIESLGDIYIANGYPHRAVDLYRDAIRTFPEYVQLYLLLEKAYGESGQSEFAGEVHAQVQERFIPSQRLTDILTTYEIELGMKEKVISTYQDALRDDPDNLILREQLVQTYFWNGLRKRAIEEFTNIIANNAYRTFLDIDRRSLDLLETLDTLHTYRLFFREFPAFAPALQNQLTERLGSHDDSVKTNSKFTDRVAQAKEKGDTPPEPDGENPAVIMAREETALANAVATAQDYAALFDQISGELNPVLQKMPEFLEKESSERESFVRLSSDIGWTWNRQRFIEELQEVAARGTSLAVHVLGRLYQFENRSSAAATNLAAAVEAANPQPASLYADNQLSLWRASSLSEPGSTPSAAVYSYAPYVSSVEQLTIRLPKEPPVSTGFYSEGTRDKAAEEIEELNRVEADAALKSREIQTSIGVLMGVLRNRMERSIFQLEQDTFLLRFELGDYYLADNNNLAAIEQFEQVLKVDPWNTSAVYKLGILNERAGNWKKAMDRYAQVYAADPRFENVARNYNQLARLNADKLEFTSTLQTDTSRLRFATKAVFTNNLSRLFGIDTGYFTETVRTFQEYSGVTPSTYQTHRLQVSAPIGFGIVPLSLEPVAGVTVSPSLLDDSVDDPTDAVNAGIVLGTFALEPYLGGDLALDLWPLNVAGTYRFSRVGETFTLGTDRVLSHAGDLNLTLSLGFLEGAIFEYSTLRFYGKGDIRTNTVTEELNVIISLSHETNFVFHLFDTPWTNLTVSANVIFEESMDESIVEYYAPDDVLVIKGGITGATWLGLKGGNVLGVSLRAGAGIYDEEIISNAELTPLLNLEAETRIEFTKGDSTYFLSILGSGTFDEFPNAEYWSVSANLGFSAKLPKLLAP